MKLWPRIQSLSFWWHFQTHTNVLHKLQDTLPSAMAAICCYAATCSYMQLRSFKVLTFSAWNLAQDPSGHGSWMLDVLGMCLACRAAPFCKQLSWKTLFTSFTWAFPHDLATSLARFLTKKNHPCNPGDRWDRCATLRPAPTFHGFQECHHGLKGHRIGIEHRSGVICVIHGVIERPLKKKTCVVNGWKYVEMGHVNKHATWQTLANIYGLGLDMLKLLARLQLTKETACKHLQPGWSEATTILIPIMAVEVGWAIPARHEEQIETRTSAGRGPAKHVRKTTIVLDCRLISDWSWLIRL